MADMSTSPNNAIDDREVSDVMDESPENLPKKAWATLVLFAAFVVGTCGCMISLFFD